MSQENLGNLGHSNWTVEQIDAAYKLAKIYIPVLYPDQLMELSGISGAYIDVLHNVAKSADDFEILLKIYCVGAISMLLLLNPSFELAVLKPMLLKNIENIKLEIKRKEKACEILRTANEKIGGGKT